MARCKIIIMFALLSLLIVCASPAAHARKPSRRLTSSYPKSGSSPSISTPSPDITTPSPDTTTPSPDITTPSPDTTTPSPDITTPSPDTTTPSPDTTTPTPDISSPTPDITTPTPDTSSPSTIPPATSTPTGGYGGYGSHSGCGTPKFWIAHPVKVPKILSLVSSLAKLFGPQVLKFLGHKSVFDAVKDSSPDAMPSLAREGAASLINAYAYKDFPLSSMDVVSQFNNALSSPDLAAQQAVAFQRYNEAV